jgi:very-short-patch-repair endonuclease
MTTAGITVLRFSDREVLMNPDEVLKEIWRQL